MNEKERMNDNDKKIFNAIKPKLLAINEKKNLNFEDKDSYYGFGWSHNLGKPGLWSEGPMSTLLFRTKEDYGNLKLEISCRPYITKKNNILEFEIYVKRYSKPLTNEADYVFLGAWNFKKEIFKKEKKYIKNGGKFITHVPVPKII